MPLSSIQLEAFYAIARSGSFLSASKTIGLSQPALSQRINNLEHELGCRVFTRDAAGTKLTDIGERLLRYCKMQFNLEDEFLNEIKGDNKGFSGVIRVGGFSTVMRSRVLPKLDELISENPGVRIESFTRELRELVPLLRKGEIDFAVLDHQLEGCESKELEAEFYVLIKRAKGNERNDVFLDHDPEDKTTLRFLGLKKAPRRSFLDNIEEILYGVSRGWGRAVVPRHLIEGRKDLIEVKDFRPMRSSVFLNFYGEPFPSKLQTAIVQALRE
jgi:DNA-binding transcriptional LysR family regulator